MRPPAKKPHPQSQTSRLVPPMQSSATLPVSSRRQSYQASPILMAPRDVQFRRQSHNPTPTTSQVNLHTPSPLSSSSSISPQQQRPHRVPTVAPVTNRQASPKSRSVETQPDQVTENPNNLSSIGIGMVMLDDDDDESEESSSSQPSTTPDGGKPKNSSNTSFRLKTPPEHTQPENSRNVTTLQGDISSPPLAIQPRKAPLEEMLDLPEESPPPYSTPIKEVRPNEFGRFPSQPSSTQGSGSAFHSEVAPLNPNAFVPMQAPSRAPSVQNQPFFRSDAPRSYPPSRYSPERAGFEDNHSVHPSVSSNSSSSRSSGPPSSRRVPKRLVMPAPLAQSNAIPPQYQNHPPLTQLPPQRPTRQMPPFAPEPMPSAQIFVKAQAQEIHLAPSGVGKLKKRLSLIGSASHHPPVVTTVSFAPPIIGFNSLSQDDEFRNQLAHKRVLSKRRSNW